MSWPSFILFVLITAILLSTLTMAAALLVMLLVILYGHLRYRDERAAPRE